MEKNKIDWMSIVVVFYVLTMITPWVQSSEILVIFPTTAQSHYRVVQPLIHGLLDRGHSITAITNYPDVNERANLSQINIGGLKPHSKFGTTGNNMITTLSRLVRNANIYANILDYAPVANLLRSGRKFDLVIVEFMVNTPIFAPIATIVDAPIIGFCPMMIFPWTDELMGLEMTTSYIPTFFTNSTDRMSFVQRFNNFLLSIVFKHIFKRMYSPEVQKIHRHHYGIQTESLMKSMENISIIFMNNHLSIFMALPKVPGIVDVGGIHVVDEKPLSHDLNDFINNADYGVILFSLGSVVSETTLGVDKLNNILEAFSKLKQRIIMKFDAKSSEIQLPANVKVVKWFPQRDLLAQSKVLLFISHAGIMSVIETIHCGKPMVAIPIFGDQQLNANFLVEKQVAITIDYTHLKSDLLYNVINEALTENYRINAKKLQQLYNDRPQSPLETAIFWTEYILRNKNESKNLLKTTRIHLNFYQIHMIDIFAVIILPISIILWSTFKKYLIYQ